MQQTWIILGASSSMARAFVRELAARGDSVLLAGRDMADLAALASDAGLRGAPLAEAIAFDARDPVSFGPIIERATAVEGTISCAVFVGSMPPQSAIDADPSLIDGTVTDSYTGPARFLHMLAPLLEQRGTGTVIGVGSVAGDRGRLPNYVYGSAKAGFHAYLSGLRNRLGRSGVHVVTVKPGVIDTAMTWGLPGIKKAAAPEAVAAALIRAAEKKRNILYTPSIWRWIMLIIRTIPEPVFKKLRI
ncbi:SDR family NAD(P)-dependent oxidoreductase [Frigidibacter sp. ROC022]|uniref:SDR family NAD(P)-dependent oxidoreductase n=1 Tax=Frigidibacter sp. ROC022 TaxID=2971796 RepID=UPI00215A5677|nr:SDR family NAD(P)-dependent oxidoreductase [Frigidibacter sp. ROC022]MCR8724008.1 SDR family NAD(P)-dependent oxidoreductase [Frigidibacter sp. ROC022]